MFEPTSMHAEMIAAKHRSHIGIESCLRRMHESFYWPQMAAAMKNHIAQCDICVRHQRIPPREPMSLHNVPDLSWVKIAADIYELDGCVLLVLRDYYSNYVEVESIRELNCVAVIQVMHSMFASWGFPQMLVTNNGPCFSFVDFKCFVEHRGIQHTISSSRYALSNEKAEGAVDALSASVRRLVSMRQKNCSTIATH